MSLVAAAVFLVGGATWAASPTFGGLEVVRIVLDGKDIESDVPGVVLQGRTVLPVRALANALGLEVQWDAETKTVVLTRKVKETPAPSTKGLGLAVSNADGVGLAIDGVIFDLGPESANSTVAVTVNTTLSNPTDKRIPIADIPVSLVVVPDRSQSSGEPSNVELNPCPPGWNWIKTPVGNVCTPGPGVDDPSGNWLPALMQRMQGASDGTATDSSLRVQPISGKWTALEGEKLPEAIEPKSKIKVGVTFQVPFAESSTSYSFWLEAKGLALIHTKVELGAPRGCRLVPMYPPHPWPKMLVCDFSVPMD